MLALDSFDVRVLDWYVRENQGISRRDEEKKGMVCFDDDE